MCYSAAWPFLGWALLIMAGVDANATRVPFLIVEAAAVCLSVHGLRQKYRAMADDSATSEPSAVERRGHGPGMYDEENHPRQRARDTGWRYWGGWLYRHLVPAVAIIVAAFAVNSATNATHRANHNAAVARGLAARNRRAVISIQEGRRAAVREACVQDERLADVVRRALIGFGVGTRRPAPPGVVKAFQPLGGLRPLTRDEKQQRCDARVRRGAGP
jgi:hypothetical protein